LGENLEKSADVDAPHISARNLAVDNHTVYTPTLYYHYTPHYTRKVMDIHVG